MESPGRFSQITTHWSVLQGPAREALDYLYRVYGTATLSYLRRRLGRGDFSPLREADAEDLFQDLFLRLGKTEWLSKPDPGRGRFRPYFIQRLVYFLRERRVAAIRRHGKELSTEEVAVEPSTPDPANERLDLEWKKATVDETLRRIRSQNDDWHAVLRADLERVEETNEELARRMGRSLHSFLSLLKRARATFRVLYPLVEQRLDGFGGDAF